MLFTKTLHIVALPFLVLAAHAAESVKATCECAPDACVACESERDDTVSQSDYSHFGSRYVEPYASVTKRNHDQLSSISTGVDYNHPLNANVDVSAFYTYSYLQDYTWVHTNTIGVGAIYHRTYGKFKPFAGAQVAGAWDSFVGRYGFWSTFVGTEYQPIEKLVLNARAGVSDLFDGGDDHSFYAGASASYWICRYAGPYVVVSLSESGFVSSTVGIQTRYRF